MSHFTHMKTQFKNIFYLKKALDKLNIETFEENKSKFEKTNLIIPQSNNYNIEFVWNGNEYELVTDLSFWKQAYTVENFLDKIAQKYASESIIGESKKTGFQAIKYQQNVDGSDTLILERWNNQ